mmetsp:Transcript_38776/g.44376  ORF Transcript_38776/g.44376 Transcript_38776/m.44376 type:complete len:82 (-) Transcript_38776:279-524(-)
MESREIYSLCPHTNDILNVLVRQYRNIDAKTIKRRTSLNLSFLLRQTKEESKDSSKDGSQKSRKGSAIDSEYLLDNEELFK